MKKLLHVLGGVLLIGCVTGCDEDLSDLAYISQFVYQDAEGTSQFDQYAWEEDQEDDEEWYHDWEWVIWPFN